MKSRGATWCRRLGALAVATFLAAMMVQVPSALAVTSVPVFNASFEDWMFGLPYSPTGWETAEWIPNSQNGVFRGNAHVSGSYSAWLTNDHDSNPADFNYVAQMIPIEGGNRYRLRVWVKTNQPSAVWMRMAFTPGENVWEVNAADRGVTAGSWQQMEYEATAPGGTSYCWIEFKIRGDPTPGVGEAWFDDVTFDQVVPPRLTATAQFSPSAPYCGQPVTGTFGFQNTGDCTGVYGQVGVQAIDPDGYSHDIRTADSFSVGPGAYSAQHTVQFSMDKPGFWFVYPCAWTAEYHQEVQPPIPETIYVDQLTLTYAAGSNGHISGTTPQNVSYNSAGSAVTAVADSGYHFVDWSDGSTANPRTDANVTASKSVTANFTIDAAAPAVMTWVAQTSGATTDLYSVAFADAAHGWVVGKSGTILATTDGGNHWKAQSSGTTNDLFSVAFANANRGWVLGYDYVSSTSRILTTTDGGKHWKSQARGIKPGLSSVDFTNASRGWAVGGGGTILATTDGGRHWKTQKSGTTDSFSSVAFANATHGWTVSGAGTIRATSDGGKHWRAQKSGITGKQFISVAFANATHGWVVGDVGTIIATTDGGKHWKPQMSGTTSQLTSVTFADATHGWAAGSDGIILATTDGGKNWKPQMSGTDQYLSEVVSTDRNHAWAVGGYTILTNGTDTATTLTGPSSVKVKTVLTLSGVVSCADTALLSGSAVRVTITRTRLVGKKWRSAGSVKVAVVKGLFGYSFTPNTKGKWRFVATFSGVLGGDTTLYRPSRSPTRAVSVK